MFIDLLDAAIDGKFLVSAYLVEDLPAIVLTTRIIRKLNCGVCLDVVVVCFFQKCYSC